MTARSEKHRHLSALLFYIYAKFKASYNAAHIKKYQTKYRVLVVVFIF